MTIYIAAYKAKHRIIQIEEHSCFTWKQEGGEIDSEMLKGKIIRESSVHFFSLMAGSNYHIDLDDISVEILKTEPFNG